MIRHRLHKNVSVVIVTTVDVVSVDGQNPASAISTDHLGLYRCPVAIIIIIIITVIIIVVVVVTKWQQWPPAATALS